MIIEPKTQTINGKVHNDFTHDEPFYVVIYDADKNIKLHTKEDEPYEAGIHVGTCSDGFMYSTDSWIDFMDRVLDEELVFPVEEE